MNTTYVKNRIEKTGLKVLSTILYILAILSFISFCVGGYMIQDWRGDRSGAEGIVFTYLILAIVFEIIAVFIPSAPTIDASVSFGDNFFEENAQGAKGSRKLNGRLLNIKPSWKIKTLVMNETCILKKDAIPDYIKAHTKAKVVFVFVTEMEDGHILTYANSVMSAPEMTCLYVDKTIIVENGYINQKNIDMIYSQTAAPQVNTYRAPATKTTMPVSHVNETLPVSPRMMKAVSGKLAGKAWEISEVSEVIGRNPDTCSIVLPLDTNGVSRTHCEVFIRSGKIFIKDCGASYGTMLPNGIKLKDHMEAELNVGDRFTIGENDTFEII